MTVLRGVAARRLVAKTRTMHVEHVSHGQRPVWAATTVVPDVPQAAALAAAFVRDQLESNGVAQRCEDTSVVVHELVVNASTHGQGQVLLTVSGLPQGRLSVQVRDAGPVTSALQAVSDWHRALKVVRPAAVVAPDRGRGLEIVGLLSRDWGVRARATGKEVWALLDEDLA